MKRPKAHAKAQNLAYLQGEEIIEVVCAIIIRNRRVLITQRPAGKHLEGFWEFPGGKLQPGETPPDGLRREMVEELGIEVTDMQCIDQVIHPYPELEAKIRLQFFRCQWLSGKLTAKDHQNFIWASAKDLREKSFPPADQAILAWLQETLKGKSSPSLL